MTHVVHADPLKPDVTIAIAAPDTRWSKGVMVVGGGYGGSTDAEIRAYFEHLCGVAPGITEAGGWRLVTLPYDHGDFVPPVADAPLSAPDEARRAMFETMLDEVLEEDRRPVP